MGSSSKRKKKSAGFIHVQPPEKIDYSGFAFDITHRDPESQARIGQLKTPHGTIETPNYIFCGTKASVKNVMPHVMKDLQTDIILANTYHCMIQPGADLVEKMGGLHKFTGWDGPMMTDSGGFQIFSMGHGSVADEIKGRNRSNSKSVLKITEEGAKFKSYKDGRMIMLTPERSMEIQRQLGADLIYQFDECTAFHVDRRYTEDSMHRSHRWGDRSLKAFDEQHDGTQGLYGIIQGGVYEDLRAQSCAWVEDRPFFGTAVGGSLGGSEEQMREVVSWCMNDLKKERPVHLLGIGRIRDVFEFVRMGIDTFDCVSPTRIARHGWALVKGAPDERINIRNARFREDAEPLFPSLDNPASRDFSKAYIHHLFKAGEMLGMQLLAMHNVATINLLMREIRQAIKDGTLDELEKEWLPS
ncbi:MAG: tRNA guanosine(34) transglycosylase Tgt [Alphaproteobacteria bacterium]|jgi:queuine tRNA-ribosyltransferase|nr:tRNA guanosine(34) transglycosylase Tgt [Alphaproteobacteria bacterium]MDP7222541.1 tRNA guanosine(34) transglycosylase Tgt [Alphaproteobacteria bacterium]